MKKLILWIIKTFKLDIPTEKVVEKIIEKEIYLPRDGVIEGDITIKGDVILYGTMTINGNLICYSLKQD